MLYITPCPASITNILVSTLNETIKPNASIRKTRIHCKQISAHCIPSSVPMEQLWGIARILLRSWSISTPSFLSWIFSILLRYFCMFACTTHVCNCPQDGTATLWFFHFSLLLCSVRWNTCQFLLLSPFIFRKYLSPISPSSMCLLFPMAKTEQIYLLCLDCTVSDSCNYTRSPTSISIIMEVCNNRLAKKGLGKNIFRSTMSPNKIWSTQMWEVFSSSRAHNPSKNHNEESSIYFNQEEQKSPSLIKHKL